MLITSSSNPKVGSVGWRMIFSDGLDHGESFRLIFGVVAWSCSNTYETCFFQLLGVFVNRSILPHAPMINQARLLRYQINP